MSVAPLTSPVQATAYQEPTHRFGRPLDDRLPFSGAPAAPGPQDPITTASTSGTQSSAAEADDALTFDDVLDMVNPLQHLPVVSTLYREITGDEISGPAKVVGGGLFGGIIGAAASLVDVAIETVSGDDIGGHIMTALFGDDDADGPADDSATAVASATPATDAAAAAVAASNMTTAATAAKVAASVPGDARPVRPAAAPRMPELFDTPAVPNLSADAFDSLMQDFGIAGPAAATAPSTPKSAPGMAYAAPARPGQMVDSRL